MHSTLLGIVSGGPLKHQDSKCAVEATSVDVARGPEKRAGPHLHCPRECEGSEYDDLDDLAEHGAGAGAGDGDGDGVSGVEKKGRKRARLDENQAVEKVHLLRQGVYMLKEYIS